MILREYQKDCIDAVFDRLNNNKLRQCIVIPTGGGKTIIFNSIIREYLRNNNDTYVIVIAHRKELLSQAVEKMHMVDNTVDIGLFKGKVTNRIIVGSIQKLQTPKSLGCLSKLKVGMIVIDECHHAVAKGYMKVINQLSTQDTFILGVTATPERLDNVGLNNIFSTISYNISLGDLIEKCHLVGIDYRQVQSETDISDIPKVRGDYSTKILSDRIDNDDRNRLIQSICERLSGNTLIFAIDVKHAEAINTLLRNQNFDSDVIHGKLNNTERERVLNELRIKQNKIIVNCMILTEGFDEPNIRNIVLARPTQSVTLYTQMIGRGLRPYEDKAVCNVFEVADIGVKMMMSNDISGIKLKQCSLCNNYHKEHTVLTCSDCGLFYCHDCGDDKSCFNCKPIEECESCGTYTQRYKSCQRCDKIICLDCNLIKYDLCPDCTELDDDFNSCSNEKVRVSKNTIFGKYTWHKINDGLLYENSSKNIKVTIDLHDKDTRKYTITAHHINRSSQQARVFEKALETAEIIVSCALNPPTEIQLDYLDYLMKRRSYKLKKDIIFYDKWDISKLIGRLK